MGLAVQNLRAVPIDEETLIERVKSGDEAAFTQLYKRHARHVAGVVYRLLGSDHHLEDIVQDTFVIGLRQLDSLREATALRRWLTTIAIRRVKRHLAQRYKKRELDDELSAMAPKCSTPEVGEELSCALSRAWKNYPTRFDCPGCSITSRERPCRWWQNFATRRSHP